MSVYLSYVRPWVKSLALMGSKEGKMTTNLAKSAKFVSINKSYNIVKVLQEFLSLTFIYWVILKDLVCRKDGGKKLRGTCRKRYSPKCRISYSWEMGPLNASEVIFSEHESENNKTANTLPMMQLFSPHVKGQTIL